MLETFEAKVVLSEEVVDEEIVAKMMTKVIMKTIRSKLVNRTSVTMDKRETEEVS